MTVTLTKTQERVWKDRYQLNQTNTQGSLTIDNSIEDSWHRVASWCSSNEKPELRSYWYDKFRKILNDFHFIPGGRITHAAEQAAKVTAHNCFVLPYPSDSRMGIIKRLGQWIETMSRGGGVGINMSSLRPRGSEVLGVNGTSSGPVPWMELFTVASKDVVQQGGTRRGAAMIILEDWHPDLWEFIEAKFTPGKLEGANVSVSVSNKFMSAVEEDKQWFFSWPGIETKQMGARWLWNKIARAAWESGEPGVVFLDRCNDLNNLWYLKDKKLICVNPCSEIPLPAYGSCLLGTFNLEKYVDEFGIIPRFNFDKLEQDVGVAVRLLDNVIDLSYYPLEEYRNHQQSVRQMGLGVTGLADALIKLQIRYGSDLAISFVENIFRTICVAAYWASVELAKEKGSFPLFDDNLFTTGQFINKLPNDLIRSIGKYGVRNSYLIAQQPSGTGSLLAGVNSGIEPVFSFETTRKDRTGVWEPESVASRLYRNHVKVFNEDNLPNYFVTAHELEPSEHILMQAAAQKWCDQAISKTVNCPEDWKSEQVEDIFNLAWNMGLKSVAVYRDKSRKEQVLHKTNSFYIGESEAMATDSVPGCRSGQCDI